MFFLLRSVDKYLYSYFLSYMVYLKDNFVYMFDYIEMFYVDICWSNLYFVEEYYIFWYKYNFGWYKEN